MAAAEGTLVAWVQRAERRRRRDDGTHGGLTRGPAIDFPTIVRAAQAKACIDSDEGHAELKTAFETTSHQCSRSSSTAARVATSGASLVWSVNPQL